MEYMLKHKNHDVAKIDINENTYTIVNIVGVYDEKRLPVKIYNQDITHDIVTMNRWLLNRGIPNSRENIHGALEKLRLQDTNQLSLLSYGLNLTDHYWICPAVKTIDWREINFFEHNFESDIGDVLFDNIDRNNANLFSPDSTLNGNLAKRWKISNDKRLMLKGGSGDIRQEPFNECVASTLMERLGVDHVPYKLVSSKGKYYSSCECMVTVDTEFLTAHYVYNYFEDNTTLNKYERFANACERMGIPNVKDDLDKMIGIDYIIANIDRHHGNFGIIRDANTLQWLKIAPLFDSGRSLWCDKTNISNIIADRKTDSRAFMNTNEDQIGLIKSRDWFDIKKLDGTLELCGRIFNKNKDMEKERIEKICSCIEIRTHTFNDIMEKRITAKKPSPSVPATEAEGNHEPREPHEQGTTRRRNLTTKDTKDTKGRIKK
jgi:hypothetical protein